MKNRIVLLGPPASGKGTQAALLSATFGIPAASTGAILREEKARGSDIGTEAERWTIQGKLFPDELALRVVWKWLDNRRRFILDGFPRTLGQAKSFDQGLEERRLPLDVVYFLELSDDLVRERMTSRLTCASAARFTTRSSMTSLSKCPAPGAEENSCGATTIPTKRSNTASTSFASIPCPSRTTIARKACSRK